MTAQPPLTTQRTAYINTTPPPAQGPASLATYPRPAATNPPFSGVLGKLAVSSFFHGALRPRKPQGLLGTGRQWGEERGYKPIATPSQPK